MTLASVIAQKIADRAEHALYTYKKPNKELPAAHEVQFVVAIFSLLVGRRKSLAASARDL
jgi:hypothetical protein